MNTLTASVRQFNSEIPTFDSALAASNEVKTTNAHAKTISNATVDWGTVLSKLDASTPLGLDVTNFSGSGGAGSTATASAAASTTPGAATAPGAIGSFVATVSGSFPGTAHFSPVAEWIDNITGVTIFSPPGVSAVTNTPVGGDTTVTFSSTVSVGPDANLSKNGS